VNSCSDRKHRVTFVANEKESYTDPFLFYQFSPIFTENYTQGRYNNLI
jgi:hypothetical protein